MKLLLSFSLFFIVVTSQPQPLCNIDRCIRMTVQQKNAFINNRNNKNSCAYPLTYNEKIMKCNDNNIYYCCCPPGPISCFNPPNLSCNYIN